MIMPQLHKTYQPRVTRSGIIQTAKQCKGQHEPKHEVKKSEASVCLNCTRKKCCGTRKCFERMKGETDEFRV
nr:MAG TPA: hypothetical protein [Caudoviricetes sp.]DAO49854.1 MAG TPA: hypothetical protein [Caudoviricetes sp.]